MGEEKKDVALEEIPMTEEEIEAQDKLEEEQEAKEKKRKKLEKNISVKVVDLADYISLIPTGRKVNGVGVKETGIARRLKAIALMFEDNGVDKFVTKVIYKDTYFVFKT